MIKDNQVTMTNNMNAIIRLENKIDATLNVMTDVNAKLVGWDQSFQNTLKAGRDAFSSINDTGLMTKIFYVIGALALIVLIAFVAGLVFVFKFYKITHKKKQLEQDLDHTTKRKDHYKNMYHANNGNYKGKQ